MRSTGIQEWLSAFRVHFERLQTEGSVLDTGEADLETQFVHLSYEDKQVVCRFLSFIALGDGIVTPTHSIDIVRRIVAEGQSS